MEKIKKYIWSSTIDPEEFEEGWNSVMKEFKLEKHAWLSKMYDMRESWIPAYFRDKPMYGLIQTTSRSESENFFLANSIKVVVLCPSFTLGLKAQWTSNVMKQRD